MGRFERLVLRNTLTCGARSAAARRGLCLSAGVLFATLCWFCGTAGALQVTDISPDAPYRQLQSDGVDASGRIPTVLVDPVQPGTLYAASEKSGVWKSVDGGRTWNRASHGLKFGITAVTNGDSLAIDGTNPARLVYATVDDDGRTLGNWKYGGLWVSIDGAASWRHVGLNCSSLDGVSVLFSFGRAIAATACGLAISSDPGLAQWQFLPNVPFNSNYALLAGSRDTLFACSDNALYAVNLPSGRWTQGPRLPGSCLGMRTAPGTADTLVVLHRSGPKMEVSVVTYSNGNLQALGFNAAPSGSGKAGVWIAVRKGAGSPVPGDGYDIFASDGLNFSIYLHSKWQPISGIHADTWSMAFPNNYDPGSSDCSAYSGSDGGVHFNDSSARSTPQDSKYICDPTNGWVRAQYGLHTMGAGWMAGVKNKNCTLGNCVALYLPTDDNDTWLSTSGGTPGPTWHYAGTGLGDAGQAWADPALPSQVLTARNGSYRLIRSNNGLPPGAGAQVIDFTPSGASTVDSLQGLAGLSQVMTLPEETAAPLGDYVAVRQVQHPYILPAVRPLQHSYIIPAIGGLYDHIARNQQGANAGWTDIVPGPGIEPFGPGQISMLQTSGGHQNLVVYVLTAPNSPDLFPPSVSKGPNGVAPGQIWKLVLNRGGWKLLGGITKAYSLFVNPYDPDEVWVNDMGAGTIKSSRTGGELRDGADPWQIETRLMDLATNYGEFRFQCVFFRQSAYDQACPLASMHFSRDDSNVRIAVLSPGTGVAYSPDKGSNWSPVDITTLSTGDATFYQPRWAFYDAGSGNWPAIYVSLRDSGIIRIDPPFEGPPTRCFVTILNCQHTATMLCDPVLGTLSLQARINTNPPSDWSLAGGTTGNPWADIVSDGVIVPGGDFRVGIQYEFKACVVYRPTSPLCVSPVPASVPDPTGCPGGPPPPPPVPPSTCLKEGCIPRAGRCLCE